MSIIHAVAASAAFVFALSASSMSVSAATSTSLHPYNQSRCEEARTSGNSFEVLQFCGSQEAPSLINTGRAIQEALSLEEMNCSSSDESNGIPCEVKSRS